VEGRGGSGALSGTQEVYKAIFTSAIQSKAAST